MEKEIRPIKMKIMKSAKIIIADQSLKIREMVEELDVAQTEVTVAKVTSELVPVLLV